MELLVIDFSILLERVLLIWDPKFNGFPMTNSTKWFKLISVLENNSIAENEKRFRVYIPLRLPMKEWNQGGTKISEGQLLTFQY